MNSKSFSAFQIGVIIACVVGIVLALLMFTGKINIGKDTTTQKLSGSLLIWGTLPGDSVRFMLDQLHQTYKEVTFRYIEKTPDSFQNELVNALASGTGPDMVFITQADVVQNRDRLFEIPYTSFPQSAFQNTFIDQGNLFLTNTGVLAFPFIIDPLVTYYNRDLLAASFTVSPPKTWNEVIALNQKVTVKDDAGKLSRETVAMGTFANVSHAKEILSALIFQTGNQIVKWDPYTKKYISTFSQGTGVANALGFFSAFSNSADTARYSWNGSLPKDRDQFIAGKLALYFGFASELPTIRLQNPNLNFEVSVFPQRDQGNLKATFGQLHALAIVKISKNIPLAIAMAQQMVSKAAITNYMSAEVSATPARRDMVAQVVDDVHKELFNKSAIIAQGFLDPDSAQTTALFKKFIDQVSAGVAEPTAIISPGDSLLAGILSKAQRDPAPAQ